MSLPPRIIDRYGHKSFGGSQMWIKDEMLKGSSCGVIAGLDSLMRLKGEEEFSREDYLNRVAEATEYIRPLIIGKNREKRKVFGKEFMGSLGVSAHRFKKGVKLLALKEGFKVRIKSFRFGWLKKIPEYLEKGDPLVMLFTAPRTNVSVEEPSGYKTMCSYHWVTITGLEGDTLWVSSWGNKCKMSVKELKRFSVILHFYSISMEKRDNIV